MSRKSLAKTYDEQMMDALGAYRNAHPGAFIMEIAAKWILDTGTLPEPRIDPVRLLTRRLKQAARRKRFRDAQGRTVRELIAAKIERVDQNGNLMLDVVWDHLHEMTVHHALTAWSQRDDIIHKQRRSATREVQSFLENNPNAIGHEPQFRFDFMVEEPAEIVEERIGESATPPPPPPEAKIIPINKRRPR